MKKKTPYKKFIAEVDDYHEFDEIQNHLDLVGLAYEYEEIHQKDDFCGKYKAIFTFIE